MKILAISDEESPSLWEFYTKDKLKEYDMIISCGDLKADYLTFLVTMTGKPLLYVHGNHDTNYDRKPPEGCDCIDDQYVIYNGIRILGLGGCKKYHDGPHQYTESQMRRRIRRLKRYLWYYKGVDLVVTHVPPRGHGDMEGYAHQGFEALLPLLDQYHPQYLLHGHIHTRYDRNIPRVISYGNTKIVNVSESYGLEIAEKEVPLKYQNQLLYKTHPPRIPDYDLAYKNPDF